MIRFRQNEHPIGITRRLVNGSMQTVARATCARCGGNELLPLSKPLPTDVIVSKFRARGWIMQSRTGMACPGCAARKPTRDTGMAEPSKTTTAPMRELTPSEKRRVRELLDANFDDEKGIYLDGYSDQRIADELQLPRPAVVRIREEGYGPLKADPEIAEVKLALHRLIEQSMTLKARVEAIEQRHLGRKT